MARVSPLLSLLLVGGLCLAAGFSSRSRPGEAPPLAGALYSATASSGAVVNDGMAPPPLLPRDLPPELRISLDNAARPLLPAGAVDYMVRFVPPESSSFTLTLARRSTPPAPRPAAPPKPKAPAPAPIVTAAPAPTPTPAPKPTQPRTFAEFDEALRASSTAQAINQRLKRGGVTFRLTHVGRLGDRGVIRFAIANEEASDFFLSIVNVSADGKAVLSETASPWSTRAQEEIFGVVHFSPSAVAGKKLNIELVESGGSRRRFSLPVSYPF